MTCKMTCKPATRLNPLTVFVFLMTIGVFIFMASGPAQAGSKTWFGWGYSHWQDLDFMPYLMPPRETHNRQWDFKDWEPEDWEGSDGGQSVIDGFFRSDILRKRTVKSGIPVLIVGRNFYNLSGYDKRRVTDFVDWVHNITGNNPAGLFLLKDARKNITIGYYDRQGLRLH